MKKLILAFLIFSAVAEVQAQQDIMLSQYMFNGLFINPGYAGSHKYYSASLIHRRQWEGFNGAPKTSIVALDGPVKDRHMGIGGVIAHDRIGVTKQTDILATYSYYIKLGPGKFSFLGQKEGFLIILLLYRRLLCGIRMTKFLQMINEVLGCLSSAPVLIITPINYMQVLPYLHCWHTIQETILI